MAYSTSLKDALYILKRYNVHTKKICSLLSSFVSLLSQKRMYLIFFRIVYHINEG